MESGLWRVVTRTFSRTAMGRAYVQMELRAMNGGTKKDVRYRSEDMLEKAVLDTPAKYSVLYRNGDALAIMHTETFEQTELPVALLGDKAKYASEGMALYVESWKGEPAVINIPSRVTAKVVDMDATGGVATVDAGYKVRAPKHVKVGDSIVIDTNEGRYVSKE